MTNKKAQANDPQVANVEELVQQMQEAGLALPEDIGIWTPEQIVVWADELGFQADKGNDVMDLIEDHANDQRDLAIQQGTNMIAKTKTFNLKKAQFNPDPDEYGMPDNGGELAQDLEAYHSIDAEAELTALLSEHVAAEIDREIIIDLVNGAPFKARWDYNGLANNANFFGTQKDWNQTLIKN